MLLASAHVCDVSMAPQDKGKKTPAKGVKKKAAAKKGDAKKAAGKEGELTIHSVLHICLSSTVLALRCNACVTLD